MEFAWLDVRRCDSGCRAGVGVACNAEFGCGDGSRFRGVKKNGMLSDIQT